MTGGIFNSRTSGYFPSFSVGAVLPAHYGCRGLLLHLISLSLSLSHTHTHTRTRTRAHTHTRTHTHGRAALGEESAPRGNLYRTTHNTQNRQLSMPAAELEPTILANERPQTHPLDRPATGIDFELIFMVDGVLSSLFRCSRT